MKKIYLFLILSLCARLAFSQYCANSTILYNEFAAGYVSGTFYSKDNPISATCNGRTINFNGGDISCSSFTLNSGSNNVTITTYHEEGYYDDSINGDVRTGFGDYTTSASIYYQNPSISGLASSYTTLSSPVSLTGTPSGGSFSGVGVSGSTFDPAAVGVGSSTVYYSLSSGSCTYSASKNVTVTQGISINFSNFSACTNGSAHALDASPTGGTYSGTGVSGSNFYASITGAGSFNITYTVSGVSKTVTATVTAPPAVTLSLPITTMTDGDATISLSGGSPSGGSYYVNGSLSSTFNPTPYGTYTISYTAPTSGCQATATSYITVKQKSADFSSQNFCDGDSKYVDPQGGSFYFNGSAISSTFSSSIFGGSGSYSVTWKKSGYADSSVPVVIYAKPTASFSGGMFCQGSGSINLNSYVTPTGGTFSGSGVSGSTFNANSTPGNYSLSYSVSNTNCTATKYATFTIASQPSVSLSLPYTSVYPDDASFTLSGGSPSGGTYYVDGAPQSSFSPASYSVGDHSVRYYYSNGNCSDNAYQTITVNASGTVSFSNRDVCIDSGTITLNTQGGIFYINGSPLSAGQFSPSAYGVGSFPVTWKRDNYTDASFTITVHALPVITLSTIPDLCVNALAINLSAVAFPAGGIFSGIGVESSHYFAPKLSGPGTFEISYTVVDSYCSTTKTFDVRVYGLPVIALTPPSVTYTDDPPVSLITFASPTGGTFYINDVAGTTFNPAALGAGTHTISYYYTNPGGCVSYKTINVTLLQRAAYVFNDMTVCTGQGNVTLSQNGGTYTIDGTVLVGGIFNPASYSPAVYTVEWKKTGYTDQTFKITVVQTPVVNVTPVASQCIYGAAIDLMNYVTPKTGTFSGNGISGSTFTPSVAKAGTHQILYTVSNGSCYTEVKIPITVIGVEALNFEGINGYCSTAGAVDLTPFVDHPGGTFSSADGGVSGNSLYPEQMTEGNHVIVYTINVGSGCEQSDQVTVNIMNPPAVTLAAFNPVYVDATAFTLYGGSPSGGQYYVNGTLTNTFNPGVLGIGTHTVKYVYSNSLCENYAEKTIQVQALQSNSFQDRDACLADSPIALTENGGTYYVDGTALTGGIFSPSAFGVGSWEVTWKKPTFADAKFKITVHANPQILTTDQTLCLSAAKVDLTVNTVGADIVTVTGTGVEQNKYFNPTVAGPGEHNITVTASNNYCYTEKTIHVTVQGVESLAFSSLNSFCSASSPVDLTKYVNQTGGTFSCTDGGVVGTMLHPQQLAAGNHTLAYTLQFSLNCSQSISTQFFVMDPPSVSLPQLPEVYVDAPAYSLYGGSPSGGQYYIDGKLVSVADPGTLGVGTHTVKYVYANSACETYAETTLKVLPLAANFSDRLVCYYSEALQFVDDGGIYLINGVDIKNVFDPKKYGPGIHTVTWKKSAFADASFKITVSKNPEVSFSSPGQLCANTDKLDLNNFVYPTGGNFIGKGIEQNRYFNPKTTGGGQFEVVYSMAENGCVTQVKQSVTVDKDVKLAFTSPATLCKDAAAIDLNDFVNVPGCTFETASGGLINNMLYPSLMAVGQHKITATFTSGNCTYTASRSIYILEPTQAYINGLAGPYYQNGEPVFLTGGMPEGGKYYINGIARSILDPGTLGIGVHTVVYSYTSSSGCTTTAQKTITIGKPGVDYFSNRSVCQGAVLYLPEFDGKFYINSNLLVDGIFQSSQYGPGTYTVTWKKDGYADTSFTVTVNAVPDVISVKVPNLCADGSTIDLTNYVEPKTGSFSGPGLENIKMFNPSRLGEGSYSVLYTLKNEFCYRETKIPLTVNTLKNITFTGLDIICKNSAPVDLSGFVSPAGGKFSCVDGGVIDNKLFPKMLAVGQHKILYTVENSGCSKSEEQIIYIVEPQSVTLDQTVFSNVYSNSQPVYLNIANTTGGIYAVNGGQTNVFDPAALGAGLHTVSYIYTDNVTGCSASGEIKVAVKGKKLSNFGDRKVCRHDAALEFDPDGGKIYCNNVYLPDGVFTPLNYTAGTYSCTWQKTGFADTNFTITVLESTDITVFEIPTLCQVDAKINLLNYVEPKTGSFSGSSLQDGKFFDPAISGGGEFRVIYTVKNGLCFDEKELKIKVNGSEEIVFNGLPYSICNASGTIELLKYVYPQTGTFTNDEGAVINNILYPSLLSNGVHTIIYTIHNPSGCDQVAQKKIYILQEPAATLALTSDVCNNAAPFRFTGGAPLGGKYFVDNKEVVIFNASEYTTGLHVVEYRYANSMGCTTSASAYLNIKPVTAITLQTPDKMCDNGSSVTLKGGYPYGGQYFVDGVAVTAFNPSGVGAGQYVMQYQYTKDGCTSVAEQPLTVLQTTPVSVGEIKSICNNTTAIELVTGSPVGGYYTIDKKVVKTLDPSTLTAGTHSLTYNLTNNGCISTASTDFSVVATEDFTVNVPSNICENGDVVTLSVVSPTGGTFSGSGVTSGQLDPTAIGAGTFYYEYKYKSKNGCTSIVPFTMTVNPAPAITMPAITQVCNNADPVALSASPTGGTFSGNGIVNAVLYPTLAGSGVQQMTYTVKNKYGCSASKSLNYVVNSPQQLTIEDLGSVCQNGDPIALDFVSPSGGIYSGPGVTSNVLYPANTTTGAKTIKYTFIDSKGCKAVSESKVTINKKPEIQDFYLDNICSNDDPVDLQIESTYQKSAYTGKGVVKNAFNPQIAGTGTSKIRYLIVDANGCKNYSDKDVTVKAAPYVFMQKKLLCVDETDVALKTGFPTGGTYSGDFVIDSKFTPYTAGIYNVKYSYTASNGCSADASNYVTVNEVPVATIQQYPNICINSDSFDLFGGLPTGGTYYVNGTKTTSFNPTKVGVGTYKVKYLASNASGCSSSVETSFQVMATEQVSIVGLKSAYCKNTTAVDLSGYPDGGKFYVNSKLSNQLNPSLLDVGTSKVSYAYDSKQGCTVTTSQEVAITPVPDVPQLDLKSVYCPGDEITLSPSNYKAEYQLMVKSSLSSLPVKADYGKTIYKADVVNSLDVYYCNTYGCNSEQKSFAIQVENRNPEITTTSKNLKKGELLQLKFVDTYDYMTSYEWQFSDGGVSYEAQPYHYFNVPGYNSIDLKYCTKSGCNFSKKLNNYIYVVNSDNLTTDIKELIDRINLKVYPVPAKDVVNISLDYDGDYSYVLFDTKGNFLLSEKNKMGDSKINLTSFSSGTYMLRINIDGKQISKTLIVQ